MIKKLLHFRGPVVLLLILSPALVSAAATPAPSSGQALEVSPVVQELNVDPGRTLTQTIRVHNISRTSQVVSTEVDDFTASGETGLPKLELHEATPGPYSLKTWAVLPAKVTLVPRQIASITVRFHIPVGATPGSHFGILRFTGTPPGLEGQGVSISTSVGVLELLRVSGAINESLRVVEFSANQNGVNHGLFEHTPINFTERLSNNGNIDVQPSGGIDIDNWLGKKIAYVAINQPPHLVLPGSIRRFDNPLDSGELGNKILFGHYTAKLNLVYGNSKKTLTATLSFWVIPWKLILAVAIILVILILLFRRLRKRFNIQISRR